MGAADFKFYLKPPSAATDCGRNISSLAFSSTKHALPLLFIPSSRDCRQSVRTIVMILQEGGPCRIRRDSTSPPFLSYHLLSQGNVLPFFFLLSLLENYYFIIALHSSFKDFLLFSLLLALISSLLLPFLPSSFLLSHASPLASSFLLLFLFVPRLLLFHFSESSASNTLPFPVIVSII